MMNDRPLILITNDDGVEAKGIKELTECLRDLGDIVVFAPDGPRSGMASAITSLVPIKYTLVRKEKGLTVYSCTGTPVDCVKLAINEVLERKPDLLASGINHGGNHAICIQYSGTMGAAAEGCVFGIPSMGVSLLDHRADADFAESCRLGRMLARRIIKEGLPHGTYLNLNVPNVPNVCLLYTSRRPIAKVSSLSINRFPATFTRYVWKSTTRSKQLIIIAGVSAKPQRYWVRKKNSRSISF